MTPRLLMVSQPTDGGAAACVADLTEAARTAGWHTTVACPEGDLVQRVSEAGASWVHLPMRREIGSHDLAVLAPLRRALRGADVVHLHSSKAGALGRLALASLGSRRPGSAFTPHGWSWLIGGRLAPVYRTIERSLAPVTDVIVSVGSGERTDGARVLGKRSARLVVIPNGIDRGSFSVEGPEAPRSPDPLIVLVGRLTPAKGQDIALHALSRMRTSSARLRLVGGGSDEPMLRKLADSLGVAGRVEWIGAADPRPHMRAADVVVMPSRWDAAPLVLLEALACGATLVCSDAIGSLDLMGEAGIVVKAGDAQLLARALDDMLSDAALRESVRRRAVEQSRRLPTRASFREAHLQLWQSLLGDGGRRRSVVNGRLPIV